MLIFSMIVSKFKIIMNYEINMKMYLLINIVYVRLFYSLCEIKWILYYMFM